MLYHLPKLVKLDTYEVEKDMVELAEVNIACDKMLFQVKKCHSFSYISVKTYVGVLIRSVSLRHFQ